MEEQRNIVVEDRSWNVDEKGNTVLTNSQERWDSDDPVAAAIIFYNYAQI